MASESAPSVPTVSLPSGVEIPMVQFGLAFGNWTGDTEFQGLLPEQANRAITQGLAAGHRAFDTAFVYGTEPMLGRILGERFATGELSRKDVHITTKVGHPPAPPHVSIPQRRCLDFRAEAGPLAPRIQEQVEASMENLGVGQVDLLLLHWPGNFDAKDPAAARAARKEAWDTLVAMRSKGSARAIGVCNFSVRHLRELIEDTGQVPALNQVEVHPYCQPKDLLDFCKEKGIIVEAYAPFASGAFGLLRDETIARIATETGKGAGQVILRWHIQHGRVVLPKSTNPVRMAENRDLWSFELSDEQMAAIDALGTAEPKRTCPDPDDVQ